ncbi:kinase-like domain-containing protein [Ampelomyces quisqualis]|uniref:Kinase-like domain-containing protein n=1 Tax=Ampelomyces quisqualis TaxID=50730 RepID=A0A6A5QAE6_AMPQU|nr:kinase-like domain-containing protein [Ampelomyces quisqualis]
MLNALIEQGVSLFLNIRTSVAKDLFGSLGPSVVRVGRHRVVKGPCQLAELEALRFVAQSTSIPVPKIRRTYTYHRKLFIELDYIKGIDLESASIENLLSVDQKKAIVDELAGFVRQLRELQPLHKGNVASADSGSCLDYRIGTRPVGPFLNHEEFHAFLRGNIPLEDCRQVYGEQVLQCHSHHYRTCFTHSDLTQRNIIVDEGRIVAIVDWAFSGWYPEYWEYTKEHYGLLNIPDWYSELRRVMPRYDSELEAERSLWAQFDEPGNQMHV